MWGAIRKALNSNLSVPLNARVDTRTDAVGTRADAAGTAVNNTTTIVGYLKGLFNRLVNTETRVTNVDARLTAHRAALLDRLASLDGGVNARARMRVQRGTAVPTVINVSLVTWQPIHVVWADPARSLVILFNPVRVTGFTFNGSVLQMLPIDTGDNWSSNAGRVDWQIISFD